MKVQIPVNYDPVLSVRDTQEAIKYIRDTFQKEFGRELGLTRISAPLFVPRSSGLNDNLNGIERPVSFDIQEMPGERIEVVQVVHHAADGGECDAVDFLSVQACRVDGAVEHVIGEQLLVVLFQDFLVRLQHYQRLVNL